MPHTLPFWLSSFVSQLLVLLIPGAVVAYPIFRLLPVLYGWAMRRRIVRIYNELRRLESETPGAVRSGPALSAKLDQLAERAERMHVPPTSTNMLYTLRQHIEMVRARVAKANASARG